MRNLINATWNGQCFSQRNQGCILNKKSFMVDCIESLAAHKVH